MLAWDKGLINRKGLMEAPAAGGDPIVDFPRCIKAVEC
jgi:hypothetical protein